MAGAARASITDRPTILWIHHDQRVRTRADARDAARGVAVELWRPGQSGDLEAPTQNPYASVVSLRTPPVIAQARTGRRVATLPAFATPDIGEVRFPVDAAYLWVDGADPQWQRRRDDALRDLGGPAESMDASRFRQHDELRYSLRSLSMFAPWIRHVYLVTDGQAPPWLDRSCTRLTLIDHRELMRDAGRLPTFNSHALAARLHHIDGLADHFVYLNDDVFFGRRTGAELWFAGNGQPRFHNTATKVEPGDLDDLTPHAAARNHTLEIVRRLTGGNGGATSSTGRTPSASSCCWSSRPCFPTSSPGPGTTRSDAATTSSSSGCTTSTATAPGGQSTAAWSGTST